jgi:HEAT repeat protein
MILSTRRIAYLAVSWVALAGAPAGWGQTQQQPAAEPMAHGKPLKYWIDALQDPELLVRQEAILVLTDIGPPAKEAATELTKLLKDSHQPVRFKAAAALVKIDRQQAKAAVPVLCEGLKLGSAQERIQTMQTIGQLGADAKDATLPLLEMLSDPDAALRGVATAWISQIGEGAVAPLKEALTNSDTSLRRNAAEALGHLGPRAKDAVPALTERLKDDDGLMRVKAAQALWLVTRQAETPVRALAEAMKDKELRVRRAASLALVQMEPRPKEALPILTAGMKDDDPLTRVQCAQGVWEINRKADEVLPVFLDVIKNKNQHQPALGPTLTALNRMGEQAKPAVPALVDLVKSPNFSIFTYNVPDTLAAIGGPAVPALAELLENKATPAQMHVFLVQALVRCGPEGAPALVKALDHDNLQLRTQVLGSIGQLGPAAKAAVPKLTELAKGGDVPLRFQAIAALWQIGPDARPAAAVLVENLKDPNASVVNQSLNALRGIQPDPKTVVPALQEMLKNSNGYQRSILADLIASLDPANKEVVPVLIELLGDRQFGPGAAAALGRMGPTAKDAAPELGKLVKAPTNPFIRHQALVALGQIGPAAKDAAPEVLEVLQKENNFSVRSTAIQTLKAMRVNSAESRAALIAIAGEKGPVTMVQQTALEILGEWGKDKEVGAALVDFLERSDFIHRLYAADALSKVDPELAAKKATPVLEGMLSQGHAGRPRALAVLLRLEKDNRRVLDAIRDGLKDPAEHNRIQVIDALAQLGPDAAKALPDVRDALKDTSPMVRNRAALAVWMIGKECKDEAVGVLLGVLKKEQGVARTGAINALTTMGADAKKAVPDLLEVRADRDASLRSIATEAVKKIDPEAYARIGQPDKK